MSDLDLKAIAVRYSRALDTKPGKGDFTSSSKAYATMADCVCDVPQLLAEVERLRDTLAASYCEHGSTGYYLWTLIHMDEGSLSARADTAELALRDFAEHGTRHDTSPTILSMSDGPSRTGGWYGYIQEMDTYVRETARRALGGA